MKPFAKERRIRLGRQRGQAIPFALVFLVVGAASLYLAFNSSQLTYAKTKLQDTADAAAYSVGILQARDLNFAAYTNRAMVANQVAAAQFISLKSWIDEASMTYKNDHWYDTFIEDTAAVSLPWTAPKKLGYPILLAAKRVIDSTAPLVTKGLDGLNKILSAEQQVYHDSIVVQIPLVADEIATANEPNTHATKTYFATRGALALASSLKFASRVTPAGKSGEDRFADVVTDKTTLDGFVQAREGLRDPFVASTIEECPGFSFIAAAHSHRGGTQLRPDKSGWEGLDATDVDGGWICYFEIGAVGWAIIDKAGYGGAANGPGGSYSGTQGYGGLSNYDSALTSGLTEIAARYQYGVGPGRSMSRGGGLQPYLELARQSTPADGTDFNRAPAIAVEVQRGSSSVSTTDRIGVGTGDLQASDGTAQNQMRAIASASAYFIRPDDPRSGVAGALSSVAAWHRGDNKWEYPSLFNPYWQSSLVPTSLVAIEAADAAQAAGAP